MEMPFIKKCYSRILGTTIAAFVLFAFSPSALAQEFVIAENPGVMQVNHLGSNNEFLLFNVKYNNKTGSTFNSTVLDETGEACFHDNYSARDFKKRITIPRLTNTDYVIFPIRSAKENIQLRYKVKVTT